MAARNQAHSFLWYFKGVKPATEGGHIAQYSGFKLVTSTFVLSILEYIFIATCYKTAVTIK